jgi:hypothetical protein
MSATPTRATMCATCPFRDGSPYAYLRDSLERSALTANSRICHSSGKDNAINKRTGLPERLCRGARNMQLRVMHGLGVIAAPTDEAWDAKCVELGLPVPPK